MYGCITARAGLSWSGDRYTKPEFQSVEVLMIQLIFIFIVLGFVGMGIRAVDGLPQRLTVQEVRR